MNNEKIYGMSFAKVYPLLIAKAEKKGRTREEVTQIVTWLTGYLAEEIEEAMESSLTYGDFFRNAPQLNPNRKLITGVVCGVRVETIEEPLMQEIRYLDKLIDELAKGKTLEKILRSQTQSSEMRKKDGEKTDKISSIIDMNDFKWTREPKEYNVFEDRVEIITPPNTDLWQRTYYHFQNDNAPVFQMETDEKFFSFVVKTNFEDSHHRFDQCGIVMYLDSENWLKGSIEYENEEYQHLGSVVTNDGYSDWATTEIDSGIKSMWYRFSRREDDYCIECSEDGIRFKQMRVCHMRSGGGKIRFGIYACSPEESSFKAVFTEMELTECMWKAHDGQQPDE